MLRSILIKCNNALCARIAKEGLSPGLYRQPLHPNALVSIPKQTFSNTANSSYLGNAPTVVYEGQFTSRVYRVKTFSICSSVLGIAAQPILMQKMTTLGELIVANTFIGFFTFVTPVLLHFLTKKYVTKVVHDPQTDTYTATLVTFLLQEKKVTFGPGEAEVPELPKMFVSFKVKGTPMLVDPHDFDVRHYARILGYDKPLNYKLPKDDVEPAANVTPVDMPKRDKKVE